MSKPKEQWQYMGSNTGFNIEDDIAFIKWLNDYGLEGWELVSLTKTPYSPHHNKAGYYVDAIFKRKLRKYVKPKIKGHPGSW